MDREKIIKEAEDIINDAYVRYCEETNYGVLVDDKLNLDLSDLEFVKYYNTIKKGLTFGLGSISILALLIFLKRRRDGN